jgi:hypothetical protein
MRVHRYLTVLAAGVLLASVVAAHPALASDSVVHGVSRPNSSAFVLTPDPGASDSTPDGPTEVNGVIDGIDVDCFNIDGGVTEYVDASDVHIWNEPGGSWEYEINEDAWFDSEWSINNEGPYHCGSNGIWKGSYWVLGYRNANPSNQGWVGLQYLHIKFFDNP